MTTQTATKSAIASSYDILDSLRLENGLYLASSSTDYNYVWIRDSIYMSLPYLNKSCGTYEKTYHRLLDMLIEYQWKLEIHTQQKPKYLHEYIHSRFSAHDVREIHTEWGHAQHDAIGALIWGISVGVKNGKNILRGSQDTDILQKLVDYLVCCEYWSDPDNGMWEEYREVHASSVGACVAALIEARSLVNVPIDAIHNGLDRLRALGSRESDTKQIDLAQLSLVYPYKVVPDHISREIVRLTESQLLRERGVIRYCGDSYYSTLEEAHGRGLSRSFYAGSEAQWTFGLPWLALCHHTLGNTDAAMSYLARTEDVMLENGVLPELYYAGSNTWNPNSPLGWSSAMYILAKETITRGN